MRASCSRFPLPGVAKSPCQSLGESADEIVSVASTGHHKAGSWPPQDRSVLPQDRLVLLLDERRGNCGRRIRPLHHCLLSSAEGRSGGAKTEGAFKTSVQCVPNFVAARGGNGVAEEAKEQLEQARVTHSDDSSNSGRPPGVISCQVEQFYTVRLVLCF